MSTQKKPLLTITRTAAGTISKYLAVTLAGAVAGAGVEAIGFATTDAVSGENFAVDVLGTTTALAGAAINAGAALEVGADGKVITKTTAGARVGWALFAAGSGAPVEVLIDRVPIIPTGG